MELKIEIPEGYEIDKQKSTFEKIVFNPIKKSLPKTWGEFCDTHTLNDDEVFISNFSNIVTRSSVMASGIRNPNRDRNWLPDKETAEAMLALCQLIQLRDCYNSGWKPDWTNDSEVKSIIYVYNGSCRFDYARSVSYVLAFKSPELRDTFYNNFIDLIEKAKPLLFNEAGSFHNRRIVNHKIMTQEKLNEILELHKKWMNGENGGVIANLYKVDISNTDLIGVNLRLANLESSNMSGANLTDANLAGANLESSNMSGANLRGADLRFANLKDANLQGADLTGTLLRFANLKGTDLKRTNLNCADVWGTTLSDADLRGCSF